MTDQPHGLARGLTDYGDADFSLYLRRLCAKSMGYSRAHNPKVAGSNPAPATNELA
jgi:dihydroxy-acid dehydratase